MLLCCVMVCYVLLCYGMVWLCYDMLWYCMLCYIILRCVMLWCVYVMLCYVMLCYNKYGILVMVWYVMLCCITLRTIYAEPNDVKNINHNTCSKKCETGPCLAQAACPSYDWAPQGQSRRTEKSYRSHVDAGYHTASYGKSPCRYSGCQRVRLEQNPDLRGGILMSINNFPEIMNPQILAEQY